MLDFSQHLRDVTHIVYSVTRRTIAMNACPSLDPARDIDPHDARIDLKPGPGEDNHRGEISRPAANLVIEMLQVQTGRAFEISLDDGDTIVWQRSDHAALCGQDHCEVNCVE